MLALIGLIGAICTQPDFLLGFRQDQQQNQFWLGAIDREAYRMDIFLAQEKMCYDSHLELTFKLFPRSSWWLGFAFDTQRHREEGLETLFFGPYTSEEFYAEDKPFRGFLLARRRFRYFTLKLYLPLARIHRGERWPVKLRLEDIEIPLARPFHSSFGAAGLLDWNQFEGFSNKWGVYLKGKRYKLQYLSGDWWLYFIFSP